MNINTNGNGLLVDISKCIGCRSCSSACCEANKMPGDGSETELSDRTFTALAEKGDHYVRQMCMHCQEPACVSVCPIGALTKTPEGAVVYNSRVCIGCRYCMMACAFNVPRYEWGDPNPAIRKCEMCYDRQKEGKIPACAEACPAGATVFGPRQQLLAEARRRVAESPDTYVKHIYGEHEVGGTSVLFLAPIAFATLGFKSNLGDRPLPSLTWDIWLRKVPGVVAVGGTGMLGLWWLTKREESVSAAEGPGSSGKGGRQ